MGYLSITELLVTQETADQPPRYLELHIWSPSFPEEESLLALWGQMSPQLVTGRAWYYLARPSH